MRSTVHFGVAFLDGFVRPLRALKQVFRSSAIKAVNGVAKIVFCWRRGGKKVRTREQQDCTLLLLSPFFFSFFFVKLKKMRLTVHFVVDFLDGFVRPLRALKLVFRT